MYYYVGIDVGGTSVKYGIFDKDKKLLKKFQYKLTDDICIYNHNVSKKIKNSKDKFTEKETLDRIFNCIDNIMLLNFPKDNNVKFKGLGFAFPGPVVKNNLLKAVNINWKKHYDIISATKKHFGKSVCVKVLNDANAAALGEYHFGLNKKYKNMVMITLGTGVGGGIIVDGKIVEGRSGVAGEISHIKVDFSHEAKKCNCGNIGCLETVSSGIGIENIYKRLYGEKKDEPINVRTIKEKAIKGDKKCLNALKVSLHYMSYVINILTLVYEPEIVVLGGGVSNDGKILVDIIKKELIVMSYMTNLIPKIMIGKLVNDAGIYGAITLL